MRTTQQRELLKLIPTKQMSEAKFRHATIEQIYGVDMTFEIFTSLEQNEAFDKYIELRNTLEERGLVRITYRADRHLQISRTSTGTKALKYSKKNPSLSAEQAAVLLLNIPNFELTDASGYCQCDPYTESGNACTCNISFEEGSDRQRAATERWIKDVLR